MVHLETVTDILGGERLLLRGRRAACQRGDRNRYGEDDRTLFAHMYTYVYAWMDIQNIWMCSGCKERAVDVHLD